MKGLEPEQITGPGGLLTRLAGRVIETALGGELSEHLGYPPGQAPPGGAGNVRNGSTPKTLQTDLGPVAIKTPRDRDGSFDPQLVAKRQTRLAGLDDKILGLYAGGMTVRDIEEHLVELYGTTAIKRDTISRVTDAVLADVQAWRTRPLDRVYPIAYFDALMVKVREDRSVRTRACYLAIGVSCEGEREVLGIWWQETEGAKFWLAVLNDLHHRGVEDVLVCCVDGLTGFPEAIEAVFPKAWVQTCIVHQIRSSMRFVAYQDRKKVARDLKPVYRAVNADAALAALEAFDEAWGEKYPMIAQSWRDALGIHRPVPLAPGRSAPRGLHHQQHREPQPPDPQEHQDPRPLSRRTSRHQADLPRDHASRTQMAERLQLDRRPQRPQNPLRRPTARLNTINQARPRTQKVGHPPAGRAGDLAGRASAQPVVIQGGADPQKPLGALIDRRLAQMQTRAPLADVLRRDPRLREPPLG